MIRFASKLAVLGVVLSAIGCSRSSQNRPEVILLLTVDTLRPDYLGFFGYDRDSSPFLDSVLEESWVFDNAITPIARTTPALASLLTGQYPHGHGVRNLIQTLPVESRTLADLAAEAGYTPLAVVSNHIITPDRGLGQGFELYDFADDGRDAAATTRDALAALDAHADADRIFLWVHYIDPHVPYVPPTDYAHEFDPDYRGKYKARFGGVAGSTGNRAYPKDLGKARAVFRNDLPDTINAHIRRLYAADIRQTDDAIRALFAGIEAARGADWLTIFTADHGEALGEHDYYYDHGDDVHQPSLSVPLAFRFPTGAPESEGGRITERVSIVDVAPTLAEFLDVPLERRGAEPVEGHSLLPWMRGQASASQPVFAETGHAYFPQELKGRELFGIEGRLRMVLDGDWKLIWTPSLDGPGSYELYSLVDDPLETRDLFTAEHPHGLRLRALLQDWMREELADVEEASPEDIERLRALGYVK